MAASSTSVDEQIRQLNSARKIVLGDANIYPQIIQGILPVIGPDARVELRRWGADFLAETFSTPALPTSQKETLSLIVLETLKSMIENPHEDTSVIKSVVQTAASIYPLVFRWIVNNAYDIPTWERMAAIKSRIFRIWDTAPAGIRICCIKFAQRVVLVQTNAGENERQRGDPSDISLAMVSSNHTLIPPRNLEAEASGLLDRMLAVFQENASDAVLIDATLNALSILIRARPSIANKILTAILTFNPLKLANSPMTPKLRVMVKSMEKTTRMLLIHVNKRDPTNPLAIRIHQQIERLMRSRTEIFDEATRKRGPPEPVDGLDAVKRQKLAGPIQSHTERVHVPPLTQGTHTVADLFTVTTDDGLKAFDVAQLGEDLVIKIGITILAKLDTQIFNQTINGIRERLLTIANQQGHVTELNPNTAPLGVEDDDDDYEPDLYMAEDTEQILNKLDNAPPEGIEATAKPLVLASFKMPPPAPVSPDEVKEVGRRTVTRIFGAMHDVEDHPAKTNKAGLNRLAATSNDKDAWITVISRLATRSVAGLEIPADGVKKEHELVAQDHMVSAAVRESLYLYILEDFRKRIDVAVAWLSEEWYNDKILAKSGSQLMSYYDVWALKILDGIVPYLDARDKVLTRFLSEIPELSQEMLRRVKDLCRDPAMVNLALTSLLYLVMMRPPAREMALDAVEDVWKKYEDARPMASKYLSKWRPGFIEEQTAVADESRGTTDIPTLTQDGVAVS